MSKYTSQVATAYRTSCKQKSKLSYHCQYNTTDNTKQALLKTNEAPAQTDTAPPKSPDGLYTLGISLCWTQYKHEHT